MAALAASAQPETSRKTVALEDGWKFVFADPAKAETVDFDDSAWENVRVPHDWAIGKPFDMNIDYQMVKVVADGETRFNLRTGRTGALPCFGTGWYRRTLDTPAEDAGSRVFIEFDGAMSNSKIYVNGKYVGTWPYGYASFSFDITQFINFGEKNTLAVRLENKPLSSRWYSGAGLYRNVRLVTKPQTYIDYCGVYATTPVVSAESARVTVKTQVRSLDGLDGKKLVHKIYSPDGALAAEASSESFDGSVILDVKNPMLWDIKTPNLYKLVSSIVDTDGNEIDACVTRLGIRTVSFSRKRGFELNGKRVEIKGVCMHHDLGPIGAAVNVRALRRQIETLKEMGCNSIRTSHNPPSPELLDLCDELGMLVEDEAFDEWKYEKCENGYHKLFSEWAEKDLAAFVRRDRNHPCVILWSIGNEITDQKYADGGEVAKFLVSIVHREDPTRPVTAGLNDIDKAFNFSKIAQELDIVGINYNPKAYAGYLKKYPDTIFHGSETASTVSSRGVYHFPASRDKRPFSPDYQVSSYDTDTPPWGQIPEEEFEVLDAHPEFLGEYVWTGYDYLGEPTPYNPGTPAKSSYFGIVDLAGFKKDRFYLYQTRWNPEAKTLHVLPHWNWEDRLGQNVPVYCYTNYPKAELFVNGKSMGVRQKNPNAEDVRERYRIMWKDVVYQPGEIKVVAYDADGAKADEKTVKTAGAAAGVKILPEGDGFISDKKDLIFAEIQVVDANGVPCPKAANFMFVDVSGAAKLKALCNGDPTDQTKFSSNYIRAFSGKLLAVLEPTGEAGEAEIRVYGMSLKAQTLKIKLTPAIAAK